MGKRLTTDRRLNMMNLLVSVLVFGTGLVLFFEFHVGDGAHRTESFGLGKGFWLDVHQAAAIGFLICFAVHIQRHWKYIKTVARSAGAQTSPRRRGRPRTSRSLLFVATLVVMWAGFYAWIAFPGATLENGEFHGWIDVHNSVGLLFLIGMRVHIIRRWRRIFTRRGAIMGRAARRKPADRGRKRMIKAGAKRSRRRSTEYVRVDTGKCIACWKCIDECTHGALGSLNLWFHKHVVIKDSGKCTRLQTLHRRVPEWCVRSIVIQCRERLLTSAISGCKERFPSSAAPAAQDTGSPIRGISRPVVSFNCQRALRNSTVPVLSLAHSVPDAYPVVPYLFGDPGKSTPLSDASEP